MKNWMKYRVEKWGAELKEGVEPPKGEPNSIWNDCQ